MRNINIKRVGKNIIFLFIFIFLFFPPVLSRASSSLTLRLSADTLTLKDGQTVKLTAETNISYDSISWDVDDANMIQISNDTGNEIEITALRPGVTTVRAWIGSGVSAACEITVSGIVLNPEKLSLTADGSGKITLERYGAAESVGSETRGQRRGSHSPFHRFNCDYLYGRRLFRVLSRHGHKSLQRAFY